MNPSAPKYAYALYECGKDRSDEAGYFEELQFIKTCFDEFPQYREYLEAESLSSNRRCDSADRVFSDVLSRHVLNFLKILIKDSMVRYFDDVLSQYRVLLDNDRGIVRGIVYSPYEIDEERLSKIEEKLSSKFGSEVDLTVRIDPSVIGGMRIYVGDTLIDYSLDTKLDSVKKKLLTSEKSS